MSRAFTPTGENKVLDHKPPAEELDDPSSALSLEEGESKADSEVSVIFQDGGHGLDEVLERLLTMSSDLTDAVVARQLAERTIEEQKREIDRGGHKLRELESVIEEQEAENARITTDLDTALSEARVASSLADERSTRIDELRDDLELQRERTDDELRRHRAQAAELRRRLEASNQAMGWLSRRRMREGLNR